MHWRDYWQLGKETFSEWNNDKAPRLGAALAYYSVFSLGPLLMVVIAVAGLAFGAEAVRGELFGQLQGLLGEASAAAVQAMVASAYKPATGIVASSVGVVVLLFGATGVITQLKDALNTIWKVQAKPGGGIRVFVKTYIVSLAAIIGIGFLLIISLVLSAVLAAFGRYAAGWLPLPEAVLQVGNFVLSFTVLTLLFAFMYKFLPDVHIRWRDVLPGAALTSLLFSVGKLAIGLYLGKASIGSAYGAAGSIVVLLIWIYYSAQIFFFGAAFTRVHAVWRGRAIRPTADAQRLDAKALVDQGLAPQT